MKGYNHRGQTLSATGVTLGELEREDEEMVHCPHIMYGKDEEKTLNMRKESCHDRQKDPSMGTCYGGCAYDEEDFIPRELMPKGRFLSKAAVYLALAILPDRKDPELAQIAGCAVGTVKGYRVKWRNMTPEEQGDAIRAAVDYCSERLSSQMEDEEE